MGTQSKSYTWPEWGPTKVGAEKWEMGNGVSFCIHKCVHVNHCVAN